MKKLFITAVFVSTLGIANAQSLTSKNGTPILPEAGDWSIGFDASPVLYYFGNLFNNTSGNNVGMNFVDSAVIVGKYMKDDATAYRGKVALNFGSGSVESNPGSTTSDSLNNPSKTSTSSNFIKLGLGLQKYRGKGRLRGFYGAEAEVGFGGGKNTYEFAKDGDATNQGLVNRTTEFKKSGTFLFGVRGFVGAEYFFAPKISVAAEYGWGISFKSNGATETTTEQFDITSGTVVTKTSDGAKDSDFRVGTDNASGSIVLSFYF
jgi:hypothetical protein